MSKQSNKTSKIHSPFLTNQLICPLKTKWRIFEALLKKNQHALKSTTKLWWENHSPFCSLDDLDQLMSQTFNELVSNITLIVENHYPMYQLRRICGLLSFLTTTLKKERSLVVSNLRLVTKDFRFEPGC